jgi:hypothetical protein
MRNNRLALYKAIKILETLKSGRYVPSFEVLPAVEALEQSDRPNAANMLLRAWVKFEL